MSSVGSWIRLLIIRTVVRKMNKTTCFLLLLCLAALMIPSSPAEDQEGWQSFKMSYNFDKKGYEGLTSHRLMEPQIKTFIQLPNMKNAAGFAAGWADGLFKVDIDGDGKHDAEARKPVLQVRFDLTFEDGTADPYDAWIYRYNTELGDKTDTQLWRWRRSCSWVGKVLGEVVEIYDDNGNGLYDDLMEDSVRIGSSSAAGPYSGFIVIKGDLYRCKVDTHGHTFSVKAYEGPTGTLNLTKGLSKPAKGLGAPLAFVLESTGEGDRVVIDAAGNKPSPIPTGKYKLRVGILTDRIFVTNGGHDEITIEHGTETVYEWGGPYELDTKALSEKGGYTLEADRSGNRFRYKQVFTESPVVKVAFPFVKGAKGERYYGNPLYNDLEGNCFPDETLQTLTVTINDYKKKQVNKGEQQWQRRGNAGYGFADGYTFESYQWPALEFRGIATVHVKCTSKVFGDLEFKAEVDVQLE